MSESRAGGSRFYLPDARGTVHVALDAGYTAQDATYTDSFGNRQSGSGYNDPTPFGWGGVVGYQQDTSGLLLLGHRYYDPATGRFLSQDPAGDGDNWYAYCGNNPINGVDPSGLLPQTVDGVDVQIDGFINTNAPNSYGDASYDRFVQYHDSLTSTLGMYTTSYQDAVKEVAGANVDDRFTPEQQSDIVSALMSIASTKRGTSIMSTALFNGISTSILYNFADASSDATATGNVYLDPEYLKTFDTWRTDGKNEFWQQTTVLIALAHELGHALAGASDSPGGLGDANMIANENPILKELGETTRVHYLYGRQRPYYGIPGAELGPHSFPVIR